MYKRQLLAVSHRPYGTGFYYGDARQSPDVDGYTAECRHAATVEACEPAGEGAFRVIARCYNRFCEGDELEALSPGPHVPRVRVRNLAWLPEQMCIRDSNIRVLRWHGTIR